MLEKNRQSILDNNYFLNKVKDGRKKDKFQDDKAKCFIIAFFISLVLIVGIYFLSPYSKTYRVVVKGNHYLKDEDIISKANLSKYYLLTFPPVHEKELLKDPFINEVKINMLDGNIVSIDVVENKAIGYIYEDDVSKILLIDDSKVDITKDNIYLIEKVPLIEGYAKEELKKIERGFVDIDYTIINEISEIHKYPVSYDLEQMEVIMRDGNYCFMSSSGLKLLENYYSISSSIDRNKGHVCMYMDELTNSAYVSSCPWQQVEGTINIENNKTEETN